MEIDQYLSQLPEEQYYYYPNPGNAGDSLITHATYQAFKRNNLNFKTITYEGKWHRGKLDDDLAGKSIIYSGGGAFASTYQHAFNFLLKHYQQAKRFIILPHTINSRPDVWKLLGENVDIICREETSFKYLSQHITRANIYLMEDMAFGTNLQQTFRDSSGYINFDYIFSKKPKQCAHMLKHRLQEILSGNNRESERSLSAFRQDIEATNLKIPEYNLDVSGTFSFYDFSESAVHEVCDNLMRFLDRFDLVRTNRLHVCIASALLGKKVHFYPNNYYKNQAVYEYSLRGKFPNVIWMG